MDSKIPSNSDEESTIKVSLKSTEQPSKIVKPPPPSPPPPIAIPSNSDDTTESENESTNVRNSDQILHNDDSNQGESSDVNDNENGR